MNRPSLIELVRAELRYELSHRNPWGDKEWEYVEIALNDRYVLDLFTGERVPAGKYMVIEKQTDIWRLENGDLGIYDVAARVAKARLVEAE